MQTPPPNFAVDIKPLFRERDRRAMTFLFDLWDYEAVRENAEAILAATEGGDMPCDGRGRSSGSRYSGAGSRGVVSRRSGRMMPLIRTRSRKERHDQWGPRHRVQPRGREGARLLPGHARPPVRGRRRRLAHLRLAAQRVVIFGDCSTILMR